MDPSGAHRAIVPPPDETNHFRSASGKFVSASAGPNFESMLGAMGSGSVHQSLQLQNTILNADVGGGTSNLAISSKGDVLSCSCINVGGHLLGIEEDFTIWRIDGPTEFLMHELNMQYKLGDTILEADARLLAREYAQALVEVLQSPATSKIAQNLMMTNNLVFFYLCSVNIFWEFEPKCL